MLTLKIRSRACGSVSLRSVIKALINSEHSVNLELLRTGLLVAVGFRATKYTRTKMNVRFENSLAAPGRFVITLLSLRYL